MVTNTVTGGAGLAILLALLISRPELRFGRKLAVSTSGAVVVLAVTALSAGAAARPGEDGARAANVLGAVLALGAALAAIPQPLSLLRDRTQDLSGLSPLRWRLAAGACAAWLTYGVTTGQAAVWLSAGVSLAGALIVCVVLVLGARPAAVRPAVGVARLRSAEAPTLVLPALRCRELSLAQG